MLKENKDVIQERDSQNKDSIQGRGERNLQDNNCAASIESKWFRLDQPEGPRRDISREKKPQNPKRTKQP